MRVGQLFPSRFLKAHDLDGPTPLTIRGVTLEHMSATNDDRPVLAFEETGKILVLNKGNCLALTEICGSDDTSEWSGHRVCVFPTKTELKGRPVDCVRIRDIRG